MIVMKAASDLGFDPTGLMRGCWLKSEVLFESGVGQNGSNRSINCYCLIGL